MIIFVNLLILILFCFRLAERNCIEIVQKLQQLSLINVIYTLDGKEYLTHQELTKEIREELQVHGGTQNLYAVLTLDRIPV